MASKPVTETPNASRLLVLAFAAGAARFLATIAKHDPDAVPARVCPKCGHRST